MRIQHILVQQIATICSIQVDPQSIDTTGGYKAGVTRALQQTLQNRQPFATKQGTSWEGSTPGPTGFLQYTKRNGERKTNAEKQSQSGVWMR